jgi:phosphatidate cytidylyltransferase
MTGSLLFKESLILLLGVIVFLGLLEYYRLMEKAGTYPFTGAGITAGVLLYLLFAYFSYMHNSYKWMVVAIPLIALIFIAEIWRNKEEPFRNIAVTLMGIWYLVMPVIMLLHIAFRFNDAADDFHGSLLLGYLILIWANDTGAYFIGSRFGKRKLFERISPGKTWEGFYGGMMISLIASVAVSVYIHELSLSQWMVVSILAVTAGTAGDLVKSLLKRSVGVKDSGTILPGHGGILDRFDALLLSAPFVYFYLFLIGKIF